MAEIDAKLRQSILQALAQSETPLLIPDVLKLLDCGEQFNKTNINRALYHMKSAGLIERIESQPPAWRLLSKNGPSQSISSSASSSSASSTVPSSSPPSAAPTANGWASSQSAPSAPSFSSISTPISSSTDFTPHEDDVDNFVLTPPSSTSAASFSSASSLAPPTQANYFAPKTTFAASQQVPVLPHSPVRNKPSDNVPFMSTQKNTRDSSTLMGTQQNTDDSTEFVSSQYSKPASTIRSSPFNSNTQGSSPFFPAAYNATNANSFSSTQPSNIHPTPSSASFTPSQPSTFASNQSSPFAPTQSSPFAPTQPSTFTPTRPQASKSSASFAPPAAAVVKADPWAATAAPIVRPNFLNLRQQSTNSGMNKPVGNQSQGTGPMSGNLSQNQSKTANRFDAEFGDAISEFAGQSNAPRQGNNFQQQHPQGEFTPKQPKFSFGSKSPATPNTSQFPQGFQNQKRKTPNQGIKEEFPNGSQFGQYGSQKRSFQGQDADDDPPEGGVAGKSKWFAISGKKRVTVEYWKGQPLVSIREYYLDNGIQKPGKKGVSLTIEQWVALKGQIASVDAAIKEFTGL